MTKFTRWLGGTAIAVVAGVLLFGAAGSFGAQEVSAQDPPGTFTGLVTVNGEPADVGASVEARIDGNSCGVGTTVEAEDGVNTRYTVHVNAGNGCGTEGATVTFYVQGQAAQETGSWQDGLSHLNLTVVVEVEDPTPTPDDPTPTPDDPDDPTPDPTPAPPDTGAGAMGSTSSTSGMALVLAIAVLGAAGFGIAGAAAARRTNS
jgi:hypothetical protein